MVFGNQGVGSILPRFPLFLQRFLVSPIVYWQTVPNVGSIKFLGSPVYVYKVPGFPQ